MPIAVGSRTMNKKQLSPPALVVHADWGSDPAKRRMCIARRSPDAYRISAPQPVGELASLFGRMLDRADGGNCLLGFDFPIGLPLAYAGRAGIEDFRDMLTTFGHGDWADFYRLAEQPADSWTGGLSRPALWLGRRVRRRRALARRQSAKRASGRAARGLAGACPCCRRGRAMGGNRARWRRPTLAQ